MAGFRIIGTGHYVPGRAYTNFDLMRVLDTSDEWISKRTGIKQRHYCPEGQGPSDLAVHAAKRALEAAGKTASDVDYILFSTMTPDYIFPGSGALLATKLGCRAVPALDIRMQCAAMLHSFQLADSLVRTQAAERILIVGAEAHSSIMPWQDWDVLDGSATHKPSRDNWERATRQRHWAVIFGDGAGAVLVERSDDAQTGVLAADLHTDGSFASHLCIPSGFRRRPFVSQSPVAEGDIFIHLDGKDVYKHAITKLPESVHAVCKKAGIALSDIDWLVAHQANQRISDAVCERLHFPFEKAPSNIDRYGNTSAATIPILLDEMRRDGRLKPGQLLCLVGLGAGFHWGSVLYRV